MEFDEAKQKSRLNLVCCQFDIAWENKHLAPGAGVVVAETGGVKVVPLICYDLRFPELFRDAASKGAELFVVIASWPQQRAEHWRVLLQARAIENQASVVGVDRCGSDPKNAYRGQSRVIDPAGTVVADAGSGQCVMQIEIALDSLTSYRQKLPFLQDMRL